MPARKILIPRAASARAVSLPVLPFPHYRDRLRWVGVWHPVFPGSENWFEFHIIYCLRFIYLLQFTISCSSFFNSLASIPKVSFPKFGTNSQIGTLAYFQIGTLPWKLRQLFCFPSGVRGYIALILSSASPSIFSLAQSERRTYRWPLLPKYVLSSVINTLVI